MIKGTIFDIERNSYVDGPGIRTTVFFKGCNLKCEWCHNPESQSKNMEIMFYRDKCKYCGKCRDVCPNKNKKCTFCGNCELYCPNDARKICGAEYTAEEVFKQVAKDKHFYETSGGGVTFSGGECMLQTEFLLSLLKLCRANGIHTAIDTAGHVSWQCFEKVLPFADLYLYDVKCFDSEKHLKYTGVKNDLILNNLKKLLKARRNVWVRVPVIGGFNDTACEMKRIKAFLDECGKPEKVELLPYHAMGEHKYAALGRKTEVFNVPCAEKMKELRDIF